jgi:hypothetical protein
LTEVQHNSTAWDEPLMGVIGFDIGRLIRGSGSRMHGYLVNDPCKPIGANSKRTDFALAA